MPGIENLLIQSFSTEIIYSFVIILSSLMIYFSTKEFDELSDYGGINYFRKSFLYFAGAYCFRIFIKFLLIYSNIRYIIELNPKFFPILGQLSLFLFVYFSTTAVFYLLYSLMFKRIKIKENNIHKNKKIKIKDNYLLHFCSLIIALLSISFRGMEYYLLFNILLFLIVIFSFIKISKDNKLKNKKLHALYALLFIFWAFNIIEIFIPEFLQKTLLIIYISSLTIFLMILYRVLRRCGTD